MDIIKLDIGQHAPEDSDCIVIEETASGAYMLTASALCDQSGDDLESVSIVGADPFSSYDEAEQSGLAWAEAQGVEVLYVSRGSWGKPIELSEADKPL